MTGEGLGQTVGQTPENLPLTGSFSDFPIFRPLIGMDKEEIIPLAQKIGAYETSILPYPDCCSIFSPRSSVKKPKFKPIVRVVDSLQIGSFLHAGVEHTQIANVAGGKP